MRRNAPAGRRRTKVGVRPSLVTIISKSSNEPRLAVGAASVQRDFRLRGCFDYGVFHPEATRMVRASVHTDHRWPPSLVLEDTNGCLPSSTSTVPRAFSLRIVAADRHTRIRWYRLSKVVSQKSSTGANFLLVRAAERPASHGWSSPQAPCTPSGRSLRDQSSVPRTYCR